MWFNEFTCRSTSHPTLPPPKGRRTSSWVSERFSFPLHSFAAAPFAPAEDWPGWRGPRADGTVSDSGYPLTWSDKQNVKWKTSLPGSGHASPVVSKGKVFVAGCVEGEKRAGPVLRGPRTRQDRVGEGGGRVEFGEEARREQLRQFDPGRGRRAHLRHVLRPAADAGFCYDYAGNLLWEKNPGEFYSRSRLLQPAHALQGPGAMPLPPAVVLRRLDARAIVGAGDVREGLRAERAV